MMMRKIPFSTVITKQNIFPSRQVRYIFGKSYDELKQEALTDDGNTEFWRKIANSKLVWNKPFTVVNQSDISKGIIKWFSDGELNASVNCLDRHVDTNPDKVALIFEKDDPGQEEFITYRELLDWTCRIANILRRCGVGRGDTVVFYMSVSPIMVASMLACARIGAIHSAVFAGFSSDALAARIHDAGAKVVITNDQARRGGRLIELKRVVDNALVQCPQVSHVLVSKRTGGLVPMKGKDLYIEEAMRTESPTCEPVAMNAEDTLFILYTSGSTGKPKGIVHSTAGYLLYASVTHENCFDLRPDDRFGCVADVGWITGHSYVVYGPLCNGATSLLFESTPTFPNPGRYWEMAQRLRLSHIYLAPTVLRLLLKFGDEFVKPYDRSSLRVLGSVGEPLNEEAWEWYHDVVGDGRCDIIDTWWQTETGGICIAPRPSAPNAPIRPAMPMRPFYGVEPCLINDQGKEISEEAAYGALCMKRTWPGLARTIWGDHQRFLDTYFRVYPGYYFSGDGAHRHADGHYQITGRMDDVINISGIRLGTAEIENTMDEHDAVAETAVVGRPHDVKGESIYAFVTLKEEYVDHDRAQIEKELRKQVVESIAKHANPEIIQFTEALPKTRSGKIMRRVLKKIVADNFSDLGDLSTLADPSVVESLINDYRRLKEAK